MWTDARLTKDSGDKKHTKYSEKEERLNKKEQKASALQVGFHFLEFMTLSLLQPTLVGFGFLFFCDSQELTAMRKNRVFY